MIVLIVPLGKLSLGGISEKYLPPDNSVRTAQEEFDKIFPGFRTEPITLVMKNTDGQPVTDQQVAEVRNKAMAVSGFTDPDNNPRRDVEGTFLPRRGGLEGPVGAGDPERSGEPQRRGQEDRRIAVDHATQGGCRSTWAARLRWSRTVSIACSRSCR